jgi:hypothetical protein
MLFSVVFFVPAASLLLLAHSAESLEQVFPVCVGRLLSDLAMSSLACAPPLPRQGKGAAIGAGAGAGVGAGSEIITKGDQLKVPSETILDFTLQQEVSIPVNQG